ncbi:MAG: FAD-dependent oxidoreductase [Bacteriovorax sp.]|nr:FAD-dependent oxidoreductase [Bacteriovorax sp.]
MKTEIIGTDRRDFLKLSAFTFFSLGVPKRSDKFLKQFIAKNKYNSFSPIQAVAKNNFSSIDFNGDNINRPHDVLWNVDGYLQKKGGIPLPSEKRKLVVIGGGMSGLISAYKLQNLDPLILEQDVYFGGNSKGEDYEQSIFSIGAAYITIPDKNSGIELMLKDLGLFNELKKEEDEDVKVSFQSKLMKDFWLGASDPTHAEDFIKVDKELRRIYENAFPDIPWKPDSAITESEFNRLDSMSFEKWLTATFGVVHPHIMEYFQLYCWSSFNASIDELSAAQALNFVASEVDGVLALPGGNAAITQRLFERLLASTSKNSLRAGAMVLRVEAKSENEVWITYEDAAGLIKTISADFCIVASPKFVAKFIVKGIPENQTAIIDQMNYRGYLVCNAIYKGAFESPAYDVYCMEGSMPTSPSAMKPPKRAFSDVCLGSWAVDDKTNYGVLTVYKALPYDGARQFLFNPGAHDKHKNLILAELSNFAKTCGIDHSKLKGVRMTRWGHSIPVAGTGMISSGKLALMSKPIMNSIFFANQDNWANPAFECAYEVADTASELIRKII